MPLAALFIVAVSTSIPRAALADPFPATTQGVADSLDHWYCFTSGVPSGNRSFYHSGMSYMDDRVSLYDVYTSSCGAATDIVFTEQELSGARGQRTCVRWAYWGVCDQSWIAVDVGRILIDTASHGLGEANFLVNYHKTIRHEIGHTLGLNNDGVGHAAAPMPPSGWADCQVSGWVPTNLLWTTYSDHHVWHINAYY